MLAASISSSLGPLDLIPETPLSCCRLPKRTPAASYQSVTRRGEFFGCAFKVLRYHSISPSYLFSCCSRQFDRFQECWFWSQRVLEAVAADASDNHPLPKATAVPRIPLWVISRHAHATSHICPPQAALQKGHILKPPYWCSYTFVKPRGGLMWTCRWFSPV